MEWEQHLIAAEGCVPIPEDAASRASPQRHADTQAPCQTEQIVKACPAPARAITDVWKALMQGKRPGPDPTARDGYGRITLKAWLASRLAELAPDEKYALLRAAVSEDPPCPACVHAVLELVELVGVDVNAYFPTSEGLYSLPALLLYNGGIDNEGRNFSSEVVHTLRVLRNAGVDLKLPAVLSCEGALLQTLAHQVVHHGHGLEVLHFLNSSGANLDECDHRGYTPLFEAVLVHNNPALVQSLMQVGADLHAKHRCGEGLLHFACRKGNIDVVQQLLRLGMTPNDVSTKGWTPLLCASASGHLQVVQLLHRTGADISCVDFCGRSAFSLAFRRRHEPIVSYLRACGVHEHLGPGRTSLQTQTEEHFKRGKTLPQARHEKSASQGRRSTPMRERAERAGVLDRYKATPPGLRDRAESGSRSAKKELKALHKHNHQVVDRAEVASRPDRYEHDCRLQRDAQSHRKRKLGFPSGTV